MDYNYGKQKHISFTFPGKAYFTLLYSLLYHRGVNTDNFSPPFQNKPQVYKQEVSSVQSFPCHNIIRLDLRSCLAGLCRFCPMCFPLRGPIHLSWTYHNSFIWLFSSFIFWFDEAGRFELFLDWSLSCGERIEIHVLLLR